MIKTQIIKEEGRPIAVVLDYKKYMKLREMAEDQADYKEAVIAEKQSKKLTSITAVKNRLEL
jgi:hypothetical protein